MKAPGIGKKIAQRIILELKGKLHAEGIDGEEPSEDTSAENTENEALSALIALGYSEREAKGALKSAGGGLTLEDSIKESLRLLMR
jgi:Holliday junction DNA helicase RuvA